MSRIDARISRELQLEKARKLLFGHDRGLPGERWWARPLVARDTLHWYMPSKFGLPEFQLQQYYEMQAERFRKRAAMPWVAKYKELADLVMANREKMEAFIASRGVNEIQENMVLQDLQAVLRLMPNKAGSSDREAKILELALLRSRHEEKRFPVADVDINTLFVNKRHRFVDPLFRRRRLKWMERFLAGMNNAKEIRLNRHFTRHPDLQPKWPSNMGSVTVRWPNRRN